MRHRPLSTALLRRALAFSALSCAIALAAPVTSTLSAQEAGGVTVGSKAPAAVVETLDGKAVDLARYYGKGPVLIQFWATWCSNCKQLEPKMQALKTKYAGRIALVGVAVSANQSPALVKRYTARHPMPVEVFYDRTGAATDAFDVPATSYVVVLDRTGKVVYTGQGGDQNLDAAVRRAL
jgi:thiol-disulfide isomerase/thioredoxin